MLSNLKAKLDLISKDKPILEDAIKRTSEICTIYKNIVPVIDIGQSYISASISDISIGGAHKVIRYDTNFEYSLEDIIFFDTETTGLSHGTGTIAFLIGLGYFSEGYFIIEQFLMKDYCQEKDMLNKLVDRLSKFKVAVSFNGKSFDVPIINNRSIINRIMRPIDKLVHWDLLYPSRRMYKSSLESCSLKSLESNILGYERNGDIPGAEIPEIFFNYIRSGDPGLMDLVIRHNMYDILSLFVLLLHLRNRYHNAETITEPMELYSLARIYEQDEMTDRAKDLYLNCSSVVKDAYLRLALIHKRNRDFIQAIEYYHEYSIASKFNCIPDIEISKIYEHYILDYQSALLYAEKARKKILGQGAFALNKDEIGSINKRIDRIKRKAGLQYVN